MSLPLAAAACSGSVLRVSHSHGYEYTGKDWNPASEIVLTKQNQKKAKIRPDLLQISYFKTDCCYCLPIITPRRTKEQTAFYLTTP
jgi:hypothetical protein